MTATRLRCPRTQNGKEINAAINKIWLESLTKSRSFKYIVTSTFKVRDVKVFFFLGWGGVKKNSNMRDGV